jgi:hypothetical protein
MRFPSLLQKKIYTSNPVFVSTSLLILDGYFNRNYRLPLERLYGRGIFENEEYRKEWLRRDHEDSTYKSSRAANLQC